MALKWDCFYLGDNMDGKLGIPYDFKEGVFEQVIPYPKYMEAL